MLSSEITRELIFNSNMEKQQFCFTGEQRRKYDKLLSQEENLSPTKVRLKKRREGRVYDVRYKGMIIYLRERADAKLYT